MGSLPNQTLPIINFCEKNLDVGSPSWVSTSKDVVLALEEYGCFIATYTGFSSELHDAIFRASKELFDLPTHLKTLNTSDKPSHGYNGQDPFKPLREALGIEDATTEEGVERFTTLLWPSGNYSFRDTVLEYSKVVARLDEVVIRMVCGVYGIENSYETTSYLLRLMKYRAPAKEESRSGFRPHTDKSFMTVLHQQEVNGLQTMAKNGDWIAIDPPPSAFIVMAGDACMAWTNGRIEPSRHRVIIEYGSEERYSIGVFTFIKDVEIKVPEVLVDEDNPLQFKPFHHYKYFHFFYTEEGKRSKCPIREYCGI